MSGRHKFSEIEARLPAARRARIADLAQKLEAQVAAVSSGTEPQLRQVILDLLQQHPKGLTPHEIMESIHLPTKVDRVTLSQILQALAATGRIAVKNEKYAPCHRVSPAG